MVSGDLSDHKSSIQTNDISISQRCNTAVSELNNILDFLGHISTRSVKDRGSSGRLPPILLGKVKAYLYLKKTTDLGTSICVKDYKPWSHRKKVAFFLHRRLGWHDIIIMGSAEQKYCSSTT